MPQTQLVLWFSKKNVDVPWENRENALGCFVPNLLQTHHQAELNYLSHWEMKSGMICEDRGSYTCLLQVHGLLVSGMCNSIHNSPFVGNTLLCPVHTMAFNHKLLKTNKKERLLQTLDCLNLGYRMDEKLGNQQFGEAEEIGTETFVGVFSIL